MKFIKLLKATRNNELGDIVAIIQSDDEAVYYEDSEGQVCFFYLGEEGALFERVNEDLTEVEVTMYFRGEKRQIPLVTCYIGIGPGAIGAIQLVNFERKQLRELIGFKYKYKDEKRE